MIRLNSEIESSFLSTEDDALYDDAMYVDYREKAVGCWAMKHNGRMNIIK